MQHIASIIQHKFVMWHHEHRHWTIKSVNMHTYCLFNLCPARHLIFHDLLLGGGGGGVEHPWTHLSLLLSIVEQSGVSTAFRTSSKITGKLLQPVFWLRSKLRSPEVKKVWIDDFGGVIRGLYHTPPKRSLIPQMTKGSHHNQRARLLCLRLGHCQCHDRFA